MNIVEALSTQLSLEEQSSAGLAGSMLLLVEDLVRAKASYGAASCIRDAVPEIRDWQMSSPTLTPGLLSLDSLPPANTSGDLGEFVAVLARFERGADAANLAVSLLSRFLESRLEPEALSLITWAVPMLKRP